MNPIPIELTPLTARSLLSKVLKNQSLTKIVLDDWSIRWEMYPPTPTILDGQHHPNITVELQEDTLLVYLGNLQYQFPDEPSVEERLTVDLMNIKRQLDIADDGET